MSAEIRDYRPEDLPEIQRIHKQGGLDYKCPDVDSPLFLVKKVMTVDDKVVCAVLWRVEAETYLLLDKESTLDPEQRFMALKALQIEGLNALWMQGIDNCVAWIPEDVENTFAKRLTQLGWSKDRENWHTWSRVTEPKERHNAHHN